MASTIIELTNGFADESKRKLEMGPFESSAVDPTAVKTAIKALNSDTSVISSAYLSDGGASFTGVTAAQIITTNETEINLNVEEE